MDEIKINYQEPTFDAPPSGDVRLETIQGFFPQVTSAPTWTPRSFRDQFAIYKSGSTYRFYVYDTANAVWRVITMA